MELRRVVHRFLTARRLRHRRAAAAAVVLFLLGVLAGSAPASAQQLQIPALQTSPPAQHRLTARQVIAIANRQPKVRAEQQKRGGHLRPVAYTKGAGRWQVSYFQGQAERAQVLIDDTDGKVLEAWTGWQVAWQMARGYPGAFAGKLNALYVWIPLCLIFAVPFIDRRRPFRLLHLDLLMLLGFSVSLAFFNHGEISISVPLAYPFLLYLLVRLLIAGFRPRARPGRLIPHVPIGWLALAVVFLVAFRIALNVIDSGVIDVGYAGAIGGQRIINGHGLYDGNFPQDNSHGDTYGPVNYLVYVPFDRIFGFSGRWDTLPAGHGAALTFDLVTLAGLFLLGRRLRAGPAGAELGVALAFAWASFPFTLFTLDSNSNDSLVAMLLVGALLAVRSPPARGVWLALASAAKFVPVVLAPLFATASGERRLRQALLFTLAFGAIVALSFVPFIPHRGIKQIYDRTLGYQAGRDSPFSIWGQHHSLGPVLDVVKVATGLLALALAFVPRRKTPFQVAALGAAVLIAAQLCADHWFYLYLVWFLPFAFVGLFGEHVDSEPRPQPLPGGTDERAAEPALA